MAQPRICHPDRTILIDTHCHTFNATDLPVFGFVYNSFLGGDDTSLNHILRPFVRLLERIAQDAPGAEEERQKLDPLGSVAGFSLHDPSFAETAAPAVAEELGGVLANYGLRGVVADETVVELEIREALRGALEDLQLSDDPEDRELLAALKQEAEEVRASDELDLGELPLGAGLSEVMAIELAAPAAAFGSPFGAVAIAALLVRGGRILGRYVQWIGLLRRYRFEIVAKLIETYGSKHGCVDLFTPAQVDLDLWLNDTTPTSHDNQVELMERIIRLAKGRVHAFAAFDPWRESNAPGQPEGSFVRVKKAVGTMGFVGVKLYPPMGFGALGNSEHDFTPLDHISSTPESKAFGERLDAALLELYRWCATHGVPVMAHCDETLGSHADWEQRAHPESWGKVITLLEEEGLPPLHLNLAHFGGIEDLLAHPGSETKGWTRAIGELMGRENAKVYADIGHFNEIADEDERSRFFDGLEAFFRDHPMAEDRLMFGTDWLLLAKEKGAKKYLRHFADGVLDRFGPEIADKILGGNAARYLGLYPGDPSRARLEDYWSRNNILAPEWTARLP